MRIHRILENFLVKLIAPPAAVADGVVPSTWIDVSTIERFAFLELVGATDDTSVTMQVRQATSSAGANAKDVDGAALTATVLADSNDNKWAGIEVETRKLDLNAGDFHYVAVVLSATGVAADPEAEPPVVGTDTKGAVLFVAYPPQIAPVEQGDDCAQIVYVDG